LSQLNQPPLDSNVSEQFLEINLWRAFVKVVLEITVQAYQIMRTKSAVQRDWEEDQFTINLGDCIRPIAYHHPMKIMIVIRTKTHTAKMKTEEVSAKQAKEIDIQLWGRWENYDKVYFAWECKRIADKSKDEKYKDLVPEYIKEGMFRFLDEEYSSKIEDAGMLGYVLDGHISSIVKEINQSMVSAQRKRKLSETDCLKLFTPLDTFTDIYISHHKRITSTRPIQLYHIFLTFEFDNNT